MLFILQLHPHNEIHHLYHKVWESQDFSLAAPSGAGTSLQNLKINTK
jgi:hypothetical protein